MAMVHLDEPKPDMIAAYAWYWLGVSHGGQSYPAVERFALHIHQRLLAKLEGSGTPMAVKYNPNAIRGLICRRKRIIQGHADAPVSGVIPIKKKPPRSG
jgi:hypothetical protein